MKTKKYNSKGNMIFESGFKVFDSQTNYIGVGNVIANTQLSFYIRSFNKTDNGNGRVYKKGELQEYDLKSFIDRGLSGSILQLVKRCCVDNDIILYEFSHYVKYGDYYEGYKKIDIIDGYVITDTDHNHINTFYLGKTIKSMYAIDEAKKYICNDFE